MRIYDFESNPERVVAFAKRFIDPLPPLESPPGCFEILVAPQFQHVLVRGVPRDSPPPHDVDLLLQDPIKDREHLGRASFPPVRLEE